MTGSRERIETLDVLRGFAVLGILIMNIQSFGLVEAAYFNPAVAGGVDGLNKAVYLAGRVLADQKFMTIFAVLFGAGIELLSRKAEESGRSPASLHYRRMTVLLFIGLLHAYLLWYGDVLVTYALCGMIVYACRKWHSSRSAALGLVLLMIPPAIFLSAATYFPEVAPEALEDASADFNPDADAIARETAAYTGGWLAQLEYRAAGTFEMQTLGNLVWGAWRAGGLMLLGMALIQSGMFHGRWPRERYRQVVFYGLLIGVALECAGIAKTMLGDWSIELFFIGFVYNYWASLFMAGAYMAGIILLLGANRVGPRLRLALASVGRMAFTNYLMQTVLCTTLFYGHGFGLFGQFNRWQLLVVVSAVWGLEIAWSSWWLKRFPQGPLEWLWRRAAYGRQSGSPSSANLP